MQTKNIVLLAISAFILTSCASTPSEQSFDSPIGAWQDQFEMMGGKTFKSETTIIDKSRGTFVVLGNGAQGRYEFYSTDDPLIWKGYWILENDSNPCATEKGGSVYWGEQVFNFNEAYDQYTGSYDHCGEGPKYSTKGVR